MVSDNLQDRMNEVVKPPKVDIAIPLHFKSSTKKTYGIVLLNLIPSINIFCQWLLVTFLCLSTFLCFFVKFIRQ